MPIEALPARPFAMAVGSVTAKARCSAACTPTTRAESRQSDIRPCAAPQLTRAVSSAPSPMTGTDGNRPHAARWPATASPSANAATVAARALRPTGVAAQVTKPRP